MQGRTYKQFDMRAPDRRLTPQPRPGETWPTACLLLSGRKSCPVQLSKGPSRQSKARTLSCDALDFGIKLKSASYLDHGVPPD